MPSKPPYPKGSYIIAGPEDPLLRSKRLRRLKSQHSKDKREAIKKYGYKCMRCHRTVEEVKKLGGKIIWAHWPQPLRFGGRKAILLCAYWFGSCDKYFERYIR